jgi:hypothetical protein
MIQLKNAKIAKTSLDIERGLSAWIHVEYDGGGQGFGGYALGGECAHIFIVGVLKALEIESWEKLPGTPVRVQADSGKIYKIGHFLKEQWFDPVSAFRGAGYPKDS